MKNYIFFDYYLEKRAGGPSTYLFNLKNGIEEIDNSKIEFIYREGNKNNNKNNIKKGFRNILKQCLLINPKVYERFFISKSMKLGEIYTKLKNVNEEDIIMFHTPLDYAKARRFLNDKCKKVLMSHSPEILTNEIVNDLKANTGKTNYNFKFVKDYLLNNVDLFSFKDTDIIVFPSEESMEPYYETCKDFENIIKDKKIKFLPTGTEKLTYNLSKDEVRRKYNIPQDAFVVSFVGRHNLVKGYDRFVKIMSNVLEKLDDVYVITAGIGDIRSPKNDRWIDVGWTNDPGSIANTSDLFVLPNRRTYFDLVLIEMMSIGKTCLVSNTGGNKTMKKYSEGIILFDNEENAYNEIISLYNNRKLLEYYSKCNINAYNDNFTIEKFSKRYIDLMEEIKNE